MQFANDSPLEWLQEVGGKDSPFTVSIDGSDDFSSEWVVLVGEIVRPGTPERMVRNLFSGYDDDLELAVLKCKAKMEEWNGPDTSREE